MWKSTESIFNFQLFTTWMRSLCQINAEEMKKMNISWWWRITSFLKSKRSWTKSSTKYKLRLSMAQCIPERSMIYMATPRKTRWLSSCKSAKAVKESNKYTKFTCLTKSRLFNFPNQENGLVSLMEFKVRFVFMILRILMNAFSRFKVKHRCLKSTTVICKRTMTNLKNQSNLCLIGTISIF